MYCPVELYGNKHYFLLLRLRSSNNSLHLVLFVYTEHGEYMYGIILKYCQMARMKQQKLNFGQNGENKWR